MTTLQKVFLFIVLGQSAILTGGSFLEYQKNQELLREVFSSRAAFSSQSIAASLSSFYCQGKIDLAKNLLESYRSQGMVEFIKFTVNEKPVLSLGANSIPQNLTQDLLEHNRELSKNNIFSTYAEVPPCKEGETPGELEVGYSYQGLNEPLHEQLAIQAKSWLAQSILLLVAIIVLGNILNGYIQNIIKRCQQIADGNLEVMPLFKKGNDFFLISESLNSMASSLDRLQKEKEDQKAQLIMNAKLTSLGEMAGGVAHEINNPLAIIDGKVLMLRKAIASQSASPELLGKTLDSIDSMVQRIAKIVRGLRSFSRDGSSDPYVSVNLKSIVEETTPLCMSRFHSTAVPLRVGAIPETLSVKCRQTEISQVILNLLNNAYDATSELSDRWVELQVSEGEKEVFIRVIDSGSGIPKEIQDKILQPFFTTKAVGKGTGLGLSISMGIAKSHGGSLTIDQSYPSTCFILTLPRG